MLCLYICTYNTVYIEYTKQSAPQILISTAFLIKTSETTISVTVIVSLLTSLFSLASRVSADDKVMLNEDWKEMTISDDDGKWYTSIHLTYKY